MALTLIAAPALAQTCSEFQTCDQAMKSFQAGNKALDGDSDGIPCENLCSAAAVPVASPQANCRLNSAQIYDAGQGRTVAVRGPDCYMQIN